MEREIRNIKLTKLNAPVVSLLALAVLLAVWLPASTAAQGTFTGYTFWTEVSVHQVHLPNDHILFWAYSGNSAWLWNTSQPFPLFEKPNPSANIFCGGHAGLADGSYLVAGGIQLPAGPFHISAAELFDVVTTPPGTWASQNPMTATRFYPTLTTLGDGRVIAVGGTGTNNNTPEIFDRSTGAWTQLTSAVHPTDITSIIYPFMFLLPDGRLFHAGPQGPQGQTTAPFPSYILDVNAQTWTPGAGSVNDGASAVMYEPGKIMKCGGFAVATTTTETIDMNGAGGPWQTVGSMAFERHDHSLTILPDGTVFAVGGHDSNDVWVLPAEIWDPQTGNWTTTGSLGIPRQYHSTSMLLRDGRVIVGGGDGFASVEFYNPPYLAGGAGARPSITSVPGSITYSQSFNLKWIAKSIPARVTFIRLGAETHSFDQNQRFVELAFQVTGPIGTTPNGVMIGTLTVTAPSGGNIAPPGYYMIFILDNQGVPSVGEYVKLN